MYFQQELHNMANVNGSEQQISYLRSAYQYQALSQCPAANARRLWNFPWSTPSIFLVVGNHLTGNSKQLIEGYIPVSRTLPHFLPIAGLSLSGILTLPILRTCTSYPITQSLSLDPSVGYSLHPDSAAYDFRQ